MQIGMVKSCDFEIGRFEMKISCLGSSAFRVELESSLRFTGKARDKKLRDLLKLHSPLTNSSGLSTEARRAKLELEWSTPLVYNPQCIQAVLSLILTFLPCQHISKLNKHVNINTFPSVSITS